MTPEGEAAVMTIAPRLGQLALAAALVATALSMVDRAFAQDDAWAALAAPGTHVLMRHATAPGIGDPDSFKLGDCTTQRNLDDRGRAEAKSIGAGIKAKGIEIDVVLSSQWCRARETADLLDVAPVEEEPALNSFFDDRSHAVAASDGVKRRLAALGGRKAVLVTHQVNITALTDLGPASGEMIVVSLGKSGELEVRGRIAVE